MYFVNAQPTGWAFLVLGVRWERGSAHSSVVQLRWHTTPPALRASCPLAPLCKGSCQPKRLTEGLSQNAQPSGDQTVSTTQSTLAGQPLRHSVPPPLTQGRQRNASCQKAPLCKGSCQPERLTEGLSQSEQPSGDQTVSTTQSTLAGQPHPHSVPPPLTQGRLGNVLPKGSLV